MTLPWRALDSSPEDPISIEASPRQLHAAILANAYPAEAAKLLATWLFGSEEQTRQAAIVWHLMGAYAAAGALQLLPPGLLDLYVAEVVGLGLTDIDEAEEQTALNSFSQSMPDFASALIRLEASLSE